MIDKSYIFVLSLSFLLCLLLLSSNSPTKAIIAHQESLSPSDCTHMSYRQKEPSPGMHILCIVGTKSNLKVYGLLDATEPVQFNYLNDRDSYVGQQNKILPFFEKMVTLFGTSNDRHPRKWRAFTSVGESIFSIDSLLYNKIAIIHTNGHWLWPGVKVDHVQYSREGIKLTTLSVRPLVVRASQFLSCDECDLIRNLSEPHMMASKTAKMDKDKDKADTEWRTSTQYWLSPGIDPTIDSIDQRVATLTRSNIIQQEHVQVLRYLERQKYDQHHDYFDKRFYENDRGVMEMIKGGEFNRLATVFWYLSTVEAGGHTIFPMANGNPSPRNTSDCSIPRSLKVQPIKGEVIIFYSLHSDGSLDETSLHGACPVIEGTKWAANKWIWTGDKLLV